MIQQICVDAAASALANKVGLTDQALQREKALRGEAERAATEALAEQQTLQNELAKLQDDGQIRQVAAHPQLLRMTDGSSATLGLDSHLTESASQQAERARFRELESANEQFKFELAKTRQKLADADSAKKAAESKLEVLQAKESSHLQMRESASLEVALAEEAAACEVANSSENDTAEKVRALYQCSDFPVLLTFREVASSTENIALITIFSPLLCYTLRGCLPSCAAFPFCAAFLLMLPSFSCCSLSDRSYCGCSQVRLKRNCRLCEYKPKWNEINGGRDQWREINGKELQMKSKLSWRLLNLHLHHPQWLRARGINGKQLQSNFKLSWRL